MEEVSNETSISNGLEALGAEGEILAFMNGDVKGPYRRVDDNFSMTVEIVQGNCYRGSESIQRGPKKRKPPAVNMRKGCFDVISCRHKRFLSLYD